MHARTLSQANQTRARCLRVCAWLVLLTLLVLGVARAHASSRELGFSRSVTKGLIEHLAARFGEGTRRRIGNWQAFVRSIPDDEHSARELERIRLVRAAADAQRQRTGDDVDLLSTVNLFFNGVHYVSDLTAWGVNDYWASPAEMLAANGADCEDFAIAKYFALKELGVPIQRLRITYVKAVRLNQAHMVLAYYPAPEQEPLILDNLDNYVRPASERDDLVPVYSFNDDDVLLARAGRPELRVGSSSQIRLWRGLLDKLEKELHY